MALQAAYDQRRIHERRQLAADMSLAHHDPKKIEKAIKGAAETHVDLEGTWW